MPHKAKESNGMRIQISIPHSTYYIYNKLLGYIDIVPNYNRGT